MVRYFVIGLVCLVLGLLLGAVVVYSAFPRVETKVEFKAVAPPTTPLQRYSMDEAMALLDARAAWTDFPALDLPRIPTETALKGMVIVLDPGHGGKDGATDRAGPTGVREKHINLQVSLMLEKLLKDAGAHVTLTRRTDVEVPLERRAEIANTVKRPGGGTGADLFVSVHHNTSKNTQTNWSSVWYHNGVDHNEVSLDVGRAIARRLGEEMRTQVAVTSPLLPDTNMYNSGFLVIRLSNVPAVLLESSFYTNPEEELRLGNPGYLLRQAWAIYAGLCDYAYLGRPTQTLPQIKTIDGKPLLETYLLEGLPDWWGARDRHRTLLSTVRATVDGKMVDIDFDERTRLLRVPLPTTGNGTVEVQLNHQNLFKHSNWPADYQVDVRARKVTPKGTFRVLSIPQPEVRPKWMIDDEAEDREKSRTGTSKKTSG